MLAVVDQTDIGIDTQQVLHNIGYSINSEPPTRISSLVDQYSENAIDLVEPLYSFAMRDIVSVRRPRVFIEDSVIFESAVISQLLEQCEKVAVFVLTIGNQLEEVVCQLAEDGLVLQATVLDAIGSIAAEKLADLVQDRVSEMASAQGLYTSYRFSPGYCDWGVEQQKMVFRAMNGDSADVRLTEECMMLPQKSISGIIGIGPYEVMKYNPCKNCKKRDCVGRRA